MTAPTVKLRFDFAQALDLAEHAVAAVKHFPTMEEEMDGITPAPALHWIVDDGTYLMSNGDPSYLSETGKPFALFAEGWGSGSDRAALGETAVGHDDDLVVLPLGDPLDPDSLITAMRRAARLGARSLSLLVSVDGFDLRINA
jgi:hypothetical protein